MDREKKNDRLSATGEDPEKKAALLARISALTAVLMVALAAHQCIVQGIPGEPAIPGGLTGTGAGRVLLSVCTGLGLLALAELIWRAVLVWGYRPEPGTDDPLLPACTIVVPAYNEGRQVFDTLKSLVASTYPRDKVQLIAVDDGSEDDTWRWIKRASKRFGKARILTIRQPRNMGKRHALTAGFKQSTGEVLISVDSDSMVEPDTLRNLVAPFLGSKTVGAVAGNVRVLNRHQGIIPRMIDVAFVFSFDFIRASQSRVKTVMCTPGALSAYRRTVVMEVLAEWRDQTFCGRPANIGEDRAMTNLIIRQGYDVVFQQNARVFTKVPVRYAQLCRMYLRWARSNIRETLAMARFIFKPFRRGPMAGARINLVLEWILLTKFPLLLLGTWALILVHPVAFGSRVLAGIILSSSLSGALYAWKFGRPSALWSFAYGVFFFAGLVWIKPYALVTPHKSAWLTRRAKTAGPVNCPAGLAARPVLGGRRKKFRAYG